MNNKKKNYFLNIIITYFILITYFIFIKKRKVSKLIILAEVFGTFLPSFIAGPITFEYLLNNKPKDIIIILDFLIRFAPVFTYIALTREN